MVLVVLEVDAYIAEMRVVERFEGIESLGIDFDGTVATEQFAVEEDAYLRNHRMAVLVFRRCYLNGSHQVLLAVCTQFTDWQLATGQNHRFGKILEHETECRRGIRHGIGTVEDDKSVVVVIAVGYDAYDFRPSHRIHVAGVDRWIEFPDVDFSLDKLEFGHG